MTTELASQHADFLNENYRNALVILGAAGLVIPAFARFRISPVIGFILTGLLVGPSGLGRLANDHAWLHWVTISDAEAIEPFAEIGIVLLLFSIGLELSFQRLWSMRRLVFGLGAAELLGCGLIIGLGLYVAGEPATGAAGIGLALALSSTALILPLSNMSSAVGKSAFAMLLFEDIALIPIVFALGALGPGAGEDAWGNLAGTLTRGGLTVGALLIGGRFLLPTVFAHAARTKSPEMFLSASLLVVLIASLATTLAGLSPIVGALLAGVLIAETPYRGEVELITAPFKGLALGVFLITVGMRIDLAVFAPIWPILVGATVAIIATKAIVTGLLLRLGGAGRGVAIEAGILMASPSETTLIVLGAALAAGLILPETAAFWQAVTAIGLTVTPLLARIGHDIARRTEARTQAPLPANAGDEPGAIILGFGRVGRMVADLLEVHGRPYLAVESDSDIAADARRDGQPLLFGNAARPELLDRLNLPRARALIITMDDPVLSVRITRHARAAAPDLPIIARARDAAHAAELYRAGASDAVPETLESSLQLAETALVDMGVAMGPVIASIHQRREDLRERIKREGELAERPRLRRLRPEDAG